MANLLKVAITAILFGTIFIAGINMITDANMYTSHTASFNSSTYPTTITLPNQNIVSSSEVVTNATGVIYVSSGNYSMNYVSGILTTSSPSNMTNNTVYSIAYNSGQASSSLSTLTQTVTVLMLVLGALLLFVHEAGVKIKL